MLLRIPGVGVQSAQRIVQARRHHSLSLEDLRKIGAVMKRARYFLTANGQFGGAVHPDSPMLRDFLAERRNGGQLSLVGAAFGRPRAHTVRPYELSTHHLTTTYNVVR
jgi:predicted DNA-binding helix-hairpin-helix protein